MNKYNFYYDESEHSRKINYKTITADNYYDNFIAVVVGWNAESNIEISQKYAEFEEKYKDRKSHGELKSTTIRQDQLKNGFASLNSENLCLLEDFLSIFDEKVFIYFAVISKIEHLVLQLFEGYKNSLFVDIDSMKYSIIKSLVVYRPKEILEGIFENTGELVKLLNNFFQNRIEQNMLNIKLKEKENEAFEQIIILLNDIHTVRTIDWNYDIAFSGLSKYLNEKEIDEFSLTIDKEGEKGNTLRAAQRMGIEAVTEKDSINSHGIRMADMMAGLISKLLKALNRELHYNSPDQETKKKILSKRWFEVNARQLNLYKKMYSIVLVFDNAWYKAYSGIYSDDLIYFIAFLRFLNHFESINDLKESNIAMQGEYFNAYACESLVNYFQRLRSKLPLDPIKKTDEEYFINQKGAKVYINIKKQPMLKITNNHCIYNVLSVGFSKEMIPLVTVEEVCETRCYRLPVELSEWAVTLVGFTNMGVDLFPSKVAFSKINDEYHADIL